MSDTVGEVEETPNKRLKIEDDPLNMEDILEKILSYLDVESIKKARQVNKLCSIVGAKLLFKKCFIRICWNSLRSSSKSHERNELTSFLSHRTNQVSMIQQIPNIAVGDLRDEKLWKSLGVLGQVTSLKWAIMKFNVTFYTRFINLLPNLKYIQFPHNETYFSMKSSVIQGLSSIKPNVLEAQKPLIMPSIALRPRSSTELSDMEKFSSCPKIVIEKGYFGATPQVFRQHKERVVNVITTFLSTSKNTLKNLILDSCELYLHLLEFPCLPEVTKLHWEFYGGSIHSPVGAYEFSPSFRFSEKFPNLQSIVIESRWMPACGERGTGPGFDFFSSLFQNMGTAPSVKNLKYSDSFSDYVIDPLFQVFPNIEKLEAIKTDCSEKMFHSIWTLGQNLKKLDISIDVKRILGLVADLDSYFTGFSPETVNMIKKLPEFPPYTCEELKQLRVNPSILNLKELQTLTLRFEKGCDDDDEDDDEKESILEVAGKFAFNMMPRDCQIVLQVKRSHDDILNGLEEVSKLPNVIIKIDG